MSLLIKNGEVFIDKKLVKTNILIENGKIAKISPEEMQADKVIDAAGKIIIPGAVDCHVHFRDPGLTDKEDFESGSMAAAAGGITTVLDMPNTIPAMTTVELLEQKRAIAAKKSVVNYGFHFGSNKENVEEITKATNIADVKVYMDHTTGELILQDEPVLQGIFNAAPRVAVHAEGEHVALAVKLAKKAKKQLYVCHVSSKEELDHAHHHNVFVEVTPHHLFLSQDDLSQLEAFGEMKPRLKTKEDVAALWEGIKQGKVHTIGTDHAPHLKEEKYDPNYPFGVPGCETMLPLLLNEVNNKKLSLAKVVELCCENPTKIFGMQGKGYIKEGNDADLTLIDLGLEKKVDNDNLFTKCKWSPWNGTILKGWPVTTMVNGTIVFDNGNINKIPGKEVMFDG